MIRKKIVQKAREELEKKGTEAKETIVKNFTELPRVLIQEFFGIDMKPETQKAHAGDFTQIDIASLEKSYGGQDADELDSIRRHLAGQTDLGESARHKRRFDEFRAEEKRAIDEREQEEIERKKKEEEEVLLQAREKQREEQAGAGQIPVGKQQRGSLFKKRQKTAENRPSFGKQ